MKRVYYTKKLLASMLFCLSVVCSTAQASEEGEVLVTSQVHYHFIPKLRSLSKDIHHVLSPHLNVEGMLYKKLSFDMGFWIQKRYYYFNERHIDRTNRAAVSFGLKYYWLDMINVSINFYSSYKMGSSDRLSTAKTAIGDGERTTEYGFIGAIQVVLPLEKKYFATLTVDYSTPVTLKSSAKADYYSIGVGVKYLVQSKQ